EHKEKMNVLGIQIQQIEEEFSRLNNVSKFYNDKKSRYDLKERELGLLKQSLQESNHGMLMQEIEDMRNAVEQARDNIAKYTTNKESISKHIQDLEDKINNSEAIRERELKEAEESLKVARKLFENSTKSLQQADKRFVEL